MREDDRECGGRRKGGIEPNRAERTKVIEKVPSLANESKI